VDLPSHLTHLGLHSPRLPTSPHPPLYFPHLPACPQVRNKEIIFPRQKDTCPGCNQALFKVKTGMDKGLASGRLRIPEGLPLLFNVMDQSVCAQASVLIRVLAVFRDACNGVSGRLSACQGA
jgi:hypothetical protein